MRTVSFIVSLLFALTASAQSDFDIAQEFMSKKGVTLSKDNKASTRGEDKPYSIFNAEDGKGFAIVANGIVIGYSTENTCDGYPFPSVATTRGILDPKTPIDYMVKCTWGQGNPYNKQTPFGRCAGCGAIALAQVMYYYKNEGCKALPKVKSEDEDEYPTLEALPKTTFNWDLILPHYTFALNDSNINYTYEQVMEVTKLIKYVGYAVKMTYTKSGSGAWLEPQYLTSLGFSNQSYWTCDNPGMGKLSDSDLEAIFDKELEKGRPVIMAGYPKEGAGHYFVIDGRDDTGRYHVNCGNYGLGNGYYMISQDMFFANNGEEIKGLVGMLDRVFCVVPIMPSSWVIPTDIKIVKENRVSNGMVYNLQGQKVGVSLEGLPKGIYIKDGKKYIVK